MKIPKQFRLSKEAVDILEEQSNATQFIEDLILGRLVASPPWIDLEKRIDDLQESINSLQAPKPSSNSLNCCLREDPCKHWVWDEARVAYINNKTGEVKNV